MMRSNGKVCFSRELDHAVSTIRLTVTIAGRFIGDDRRCRRVAPAARQEFITKNIRETRWFGHLGARGYAVTGTVPPPTFGEPAGSGSGLRRAKGPIGRIDFDALNTKLRIATGRIAGPSTHPGP